MKEKQIDKLIEELIEKACSQIDLDVLIEHGLNEEDAQRYYDLLEKKLEL